MVYGGGNCSERGYTLEQGHGASRGGYSIPLILPVSIGPIGRMTFVYKGGHRALSQEENTKLRP